METEELNREIEKKVQARINILKDNFYQDAKEFVVEFGLDESVIPEMFEEFIELAKRKIRGVEECSECGHSGGHSNSCVKVE